MNEASSGDLIVVKPGVYHETVNIIVLELEFKGEGMPEVDGFKEDIPGETPKIAIWGFDITGTGIKIDGKFSNGNYIHHNVFHDCGITISVQEMSSEDTIVNNEFYGGETAVYYDGDSGLNIRDNKISDANTGIEIDSIHYQNSVKEISGNTIQGCNVGLVLEDYTSVGEIYNNVFNNTENIKISPGPYFDMIPKVQSWNKTSLSKDTNIIGGPYIGGNYWSSPSGDGFSQTHLDTDGDGIAEEEYQISEGNVDYFPLVTPRIEPEPVANFNTNVTTGDAPLSVKFTDVSQNAASWSWDFDNNGQPDSTVQSPIYVYEVPGNYTVKLTVSNSVGTAAISKDITVAPGDNSTVDVSPGDNSTDVVLPGNETNSTGDTTVDSSGSSRKSSGSSSGGGGGGGSPELAKNVEVKELSQVFIINGKAVKFEFKNNATCVVSVDFDAIRNAGKTTTIVEQLKNKSVLVPGLPAGEVYKSFNVWVGNSGYATSKNIENPGLTFKLEKSWLQSESIEQDSIALSRYMDEDEHDDDDGTWTELNITKTGGDDKFLYFSAETPGYGSFVITGAPALKAPGEQVLELQAENRTVGSVNASEEEDRGDEENNGVGKNLINIGIVAGALVVVMGLALKGMKK
ncbi:cell surface protein [Methanosarcina siciliae T4/M]|uniref:Cell surface protein n=1 Tax=Methanosarcina siciliae T4/M TaxID=1434120 RepID=A0A0E3P7B9_9EURY|nr:PGF-pre-PGF domain-containing protein [Methanosarcina siciliae]AKB29780.1 cell surface protein [Methanosarcina siciliae T4/M]